MRGRLTSRAQVIHRSQLTLIYSDTDALREKVVFRRQSDVLTVKNEGFPAKTATKRSLPRDKTRFIKLGGSSKTMFSR